MSAFRQSLKVVVFPFRAAWFVVLSANFIIAAAVGLFFASFVAYGVVLVFSYAFLPAEWTRALWQWAADLYAHSTWFKAATFTFFALVFLPILRFWPGRDPFADATREREMKRLNEDLIAARQQEELRAKLRA
ncbi:hypothetical protein ELI49_37345 [Rhizobium ruizarguesonis]|uniref:Transmembrane protein n=1 Tax=Rhizobium ruizarguesonis TaxID=2081791 RepID=A0AAE8Q5Y7_9HYPH|nr:hypothetical protein [Rhizobium ruizarguesonis]NEH87458.1 hypothetical protein [Rhizobium ruizarguesonis]NEI16434.1 hypothetical protein [Rhizobium ruizarguesonis]NEJ08657.1 hypothetical protein [Rhizobium ruizarguesonis]NEJ17065.1 hypothetical protein [Rhizobium ruizarguesonis]NEJ59493.1 hypothetical protein [Rhizobium ruizarguesonis]